MNPRNPNPATQENLRQVMISNPNIKEHEEILCINEILTVRILDLGSFLAHFGQKHHSSIVLSLQILIFLIDFKSRKFTHIVDVCRC